MSKMREGLRPIQWAITSPGGGIAHRVILYGFSGNHSSAMTEPRMLDIKSRDYMPIDRENRENGDLTDYLRFVIL